MRTLKYRSRGQAVYILEEMLVNLDYKVKVSEFFGRDTDRAVRHFQKENNLVIDGLVGAKTWSLLVYKTQQFTDHNSQFLSENDLIAFGNTFGLELAIVKAVNHVESRGKGFLLGGKPKILFEGHVFWRQLEKRGIDPKSVWEGNEDIIYPKWTRKHYLKGGREYERLNKAIQINEEAALSSASWGAFQVMGYHALSLGYTSVAEFVNKMHDHEREHLHAFGKFLQVNRLSGRTLLEWLQIRDWAKFSRGYNGSGYRENKYDTKLQRAYEHYNS